MNESKKGIEENLRLSLVNSQDRKECLTRSSIQVFSERHLRTRHLRTKRKPIEIGTSGNLGLIQ
ncbi:unnamed protein product [Meloidogyne enterolobii]|uniref:Uncharacterized protein n=1 Tax=Meloidogyne enterolobii TaxID=390850 RepID=A0ACB1A889_MELEN